MTVKKMVITEPTLRVQTDNLVFLFGLKMPPFKESFVRVKVEIFFDGKFEKSFYPLVPCSVNGTVHSIKFEINIKKLSNGPHSIRVTICGLGNFKGISCAKDFKFYYDAGKRKLVEKIETTKSQKETITVVTDEAKKIFNELKKRQQEEIFWQREKY